MSGIYGKATWLTILRKSSQYSKWLLFSREVPTTPEAFSHWLEAQVSKYSRNSKKFFPKKMSPPPHHLPSNTPQNSALLENPRPAPPSQFSDFQGTLKFESLNFQILRNFQPSKLIISGSASNLGESLGMKALFLCLKQFEILSLLCLSVWFIVSVITLV